MCCKSSCYCSSHKTHFSPVDWVVVSSITECWASDQFCSLPKHREQSGDCPCSFVIIQAQVVFFKHDSVKYSAGVTVFILFVKSSNQHQIVQFVRSNWISFTVTWGELKFCFVLFCFNKKTLGGKKMCLLPLVTSVTKQPCAGFGPAFALSWTRGRKKLLMLPKTGAVFNDTQCFSFLLLCSYEQILWIQKIYPCISKEILEVEEQWDLAVAHRADGHGLLGHLLDRRQWA